MKLDSLRKDILDAMCEAVKEAICDGEDLAVTTLNFNDGYVDITVFKSGTACALVNHDDIRKRHNNDRLEAYCEAVAKEVRWSDVLADVKSENVLTPEQEYAHRGELMFSPAQRWHRI